MDLKSKKTLTVTSDIPVDNKVTISGSVKISSGGTRAHDKLSNLDYASSGHTGFASEEQINGLQEIVNELQENLAATDNKFEDYEKLNAANEVRARVSILEGKVGGLTGAFQFQGQFDSIQQLPAATNSNKGHVYIINNKEYVSDGIGWFELGDEGSYLLKTTYESEKTAFQTKELSTPITVDGNEYTTVEGVLNKLKDGVGGGENSSIDVNVTAKGVIPASGTINGFYFDTTKTSEEIAEIFEKIKYHIDYSPLGTDHQIYFAFGFKTAETERYLLFQKAPWLYEIGFLPTSGPWLVFYNPSKYPETNGWNTAAWFEFNTVFELLPSMPADIIGQLPPAAVLNTQIGFQNELLTDLLYTSPQVELLENIKINNVIYETGINDVYNELDSINERIDNIWTGGEGASVEPIGAMQDMPTAPISGYVGQIYFNDLLTNEEVGALIKTQCIKNDYDYGVEAVVVFDDESRIAFLINSENEAGIIYAKANGETLTLFQTADVSMEGFVGWNPNFNYELEVNKNIIFSNMSGDIVELMKTYRTIAGGLKIDGQDYYFPNHIDISASWESGGGSGTSVEPIGVTENMYTIPVAGFEGRINFYTELPTEKVHKMIKESTKLYSWEDGGGNYIEFEDGSYLEFAWYINEYEKESSYIGIFSNDWDRFCIFQSDDETWMGFVGWHPMVIEMPYTETNGKIVYSDLSEGMVELIWVENTTINGLKIDGQDYFFPNYTDICVGWGEGWDSTIKINDENILAPIPKEGYIDRIYFNPLAKGEKINDILNNRTWERIYVSQLHFISEKYGEITFNFNQFYGRWEIWVSHYSISYETDGYSENSWLEGKPEYIEIDGYLDTRDWDYEEDPFKALSYFMGVKKDIPAATNISVNNQIYKVPSVEGKGWKLSPIKQWVFVDRIYFNKEMSNQQINEMLNNAGVSKLYFNSEKYDYVDISFNEYYGKWNVSHQSNYLGTYLNNYIEFDHEDWYLQAPDSIEVQGYLSFDESSYSDGALEAISSFIGIKPQLEELTINGKTYSLEYIKDLEERVAALEATVQTLLNK